MAAGGAWGWPGWLAAGTSLASGWLAFMVAAPRAWLRRVEDDRATIADLAERLLDADLEQRKASINSVLIDRGDELGDLSRAVHDCLAQALSARAEARMLQRTMRHTVERQTRCATAKLERQSVRDALTGVGNRRALDGVREFIEREAEAAASGPSRRLIAMMIDMDNFKEINDALGHDAGDNCLVFLAELLRSTVRRDDHVVRLGGDEFLVVMTGESVEIVAGLAERLRALFAQMPWSSETVERPTLSIGVADVAIDRPNALDAVTRLADGALYAAKRAGRNRVAVAGGAVAPPSGAAAG